MLILALTLSTCLPALAFVSEIFVAPSGDDLNSGTSASLPVQTLQRARDLVAGSPGATVHVSAGKYRLQEPLLLSSQHSHTHWSAHGNAIISGSRLLSGWYPLPLASMTRSGLRIVAADVSFLGKQVQSRHLFVNGQRAHRSRLPDHTSSMIFAGAKLTDYGYLLQGNPKAPLLQPGAEFVFPRSTSQWTEPRCAVSSANLSHVVMMQPCWQNLLQKPCRFGLKGTPVANRGYVENAGPQYLESPGDWALDHAGKVAYYVLREAEDAQTLIAEMPVLELLLSIKGVNHIRLEGFTFEQATWLRPGQGEGFVDHQAGNCLLGSHELNWDCDVDGSKGAEAYWSRKSPGNVAVTASSFVDFLRCEFTGLGAGAALDFTRAKHCRVTDSFFHELSGAAVQIGSFVDPLATEDRNNSVSNTIVTGTGREFSGAAAISVGYTQGTVLWGNDVSNTSWTGISVGWGWNRHRCWNCTVSRDNTIAFNRVHDFKLRMNDGGGIYMLGPQNGSLVHDNWVFHEASDRDVGAGGGLYPDDGSAYSTFSHNVVSDMEHFWLFLWTGSIHDISVENNFHTAQKTYDAGRRCPLINNTAFNMTNLPLAVKHIMDASGVNASNPWLHLLQPLEGEKKIVTYLV